jgi:hypothetical protein
MVFDTMVMLVSTLSLKHYRTFTEKTAGPVLKVVESLSVRDPAKLAAFRSEYEALASEYFEDNVIRQGYMMTRATKI